MRPRRGRHAARRLPLDPIVAHRRRGIQPIGHIGVVVDDQHAPECLQPTGWALLAMLGGPDHQLFLA